MRPGKGLIALAGAAAGLGAGVVVQRSAIRRRRRNDPEAAERFGSRRGVRARTIALRDGARIFIEETGPESPRGAVFIHGSALRTDLWHYQMPGLGDHRLVFYDLRGHGLSQPKGDAEYSIRTLADDVEAVLDATALEEAVLVGHSVGGMIALQYACSRHDELGSRIKGLVLVNTTHRHAVETLAGGAAVARVERVVRRPLDLLGSQAPRLDTLRRIIKPSDAIFWAVSFAGFGPNASAKQIDFAYDMLAETPSDVIFDLIRAYRDFNVEGTLGDVTVPALVIGGDHDRITIGDASAYIAEHLPKAELVMLEACGHMPMLEQHSRFNELVTTFLNDTLGDEPRPKRKRKSTR